MSGAHHRLVVGLTGGIGSGKSTVAAMFAELGAEVIDTDEIAHRLTAPGGAAMPAIRAAFGDDCVGPDGALDRAWMRERAFSDPDARRRLEAVLHPAIRAEAAARLASGRSAYCILVVPLFVETGGLAGVADRVLVVDCDESLQVRRAMTRSGLTREQVRAVMAAQASRSERAARADDIVHNDAGLAELRRQVEALHRRYLQAAHAGPPHPAT